MSSPKKWVSWSSEGPVINLSKHPLITSSSSSDLKQSNLMLKHLEKATNLVKRHSRKICITVSVSNSQNTHPKSLFPTLLKIAFLVGRAYVSTLHKNMISLSCKPHFFCKLHTLETTCSNF